MKKKLNYIPSIKERNTIHKKIMDEDEDSFQQENPFSLHESSSIIYQKNHQPKLSKAQLENLINRLNENKKTKIMIRQQARRIQQRNELIRYQNNQKSETYNERRIEEKLMENGIKIKQKIIRMQKEKEQQQMKLLKAKPDICKNNVVSQKPMKERYKQIMQQYEHNLKQLCKQNKPSFQPSINSYSKFIAEIKNQNDGDFVNRISKNLQKMSEKKKKKQVQQKQIDASIFKPKINLKSKNILKKNPLFSEDIPFQKRADIMHQMVKNKLKPSIQSQCTFKPAICYKSQKIMRNNCKNVCERLYQQAQNQRIRKLQRQQQILKQFNYIPKLNTNRNRAQSQYISSDESYFSDIQTFKQQQKISKIPSKFQSNRNQSTMSRYLEQSRRQSTYETTEQKQAKKCTFKPNIYKKKNLINNKAQIYGLQNYLKNIERARKMKLEKNHAEIKITSEKYISPSI